MRRSAFNTVCTARTWPEAERIFGLLHSAGLHPVDLPLAAPLPLGDNHPIFPIEVPDEEVEAARQLLLSSFEEAA